MLVVYDVLMVSSMFLWPMMTGGMPALWPIAIGLLLCLVREQGVEAMQRATPEEVRLYL